VRFSARVGGAHVQIVAFGIQVAAAVQRGVDAAGIDASIGGARVGIVALVHTDTTVVYRIEVACMRGDMADVARAQVRVVAVHVRVAASLYVDGSGADVVLRVACIGRACIVVVAITVRVAASRYRIVVAREVRTDVGGAHVAVVACRVHVAAALRPRMSACVVEIARVDGACFTIVNELLCCVKNRPSLSSHCAAVTQHPERQSLRHRLVELHQSVVQTLSSTHVAFSVQQFGTLGCPHVCAVGSQISAVQGFPSLHVALT
jgi:hypothetical protein